MPFIPLHDDNPRVLITHVWVPWGLIAACTIVFFLEVSASPEAGERMVVGLGLIPAAFVGEIQLRPEFHLIPAPLTAATSLFLHGGLMHLLGNMLYLWVFGDNVEDAMGHWRFLAFYLLCGVAAGLVHVFSDPGSQIPTIGASGAISGVLGAYLVLQPKARVLVPIWFIPVYIPAFVLLILWIVFQIFAAATAGTDGGGVAWWAHIGGFFVGGLLVVPFRHKAIPLFGADNLPSGIRMTRGRWRRHKNQETRRGPWQ